MLFLKKSNTFSFRILITRIQNCLKHRQLLFLNKAKTIKRKIFETNQTLTDIKYLKNLKLLESCQNISHKLKKKNN